MDNLDVVLVHKWPPDAAVRILPQPSTTLINQHGLDLFVEEPKRIADFLASKIAHPRVVTVTSVELEEYARQYRVSGTSEFVEDYIGIFIGTRDDLFARMRMLDEQAHGAFPRSFLEKLPMITEPICAGWTTRRGDTDWHISIGFLFIEYTDRFRACLYEELMQSFGIPNDFPAGTASIFNDDNVYDEPTELDLLLWRMHTDPRLEAGMGEDDVRPIARAIVTELLTPE